MTAARGASLLPLAALAVTTLACQHPAVSGDAPAPSVEAVWPDAPPVDFTPRPIPESGRLSVFRPHFDRHVEVFGVLVVATPSTDAVKVTHAATVLAEWIDNDEDGVPDDQAVHAALVEGGAFLVMPATEEEMERLHRRVSFEALEEAGFHIGQDLYGDETFPAGPPHVMGRGRFDAALEEDPAATGVFLHTAAPCKFGEVVAPVLGEEPAMPERLREIVNRPKQSVEISANDAALKAYLLG